MTEKNINHNTFEAIKFKASKNKSEHKTLMPHSMDADINLDADAFSLLFHLLP